MITNIHIGDVRSSWIWLLQDVVGTYLANWRYCHHGHIDKFGKHGRGIAHTWDVKLLTEVSNVLLHLARISI